MPLTPKENEEILPIVTDAVRRKVSYMEMITNVVNKLRELRGIQSLTSEQTKELMSIAEEMLPGVKEAAAGKAESDALLEKVREEDPSKLGGKRRSSSRRVTAKRFCSCVKKVKASKKPKTEGSSIAICTSSLLWPHGRTLHSVSCRRKASIKTQKRSAAMRKKSA